MEARRNHRSADLDAMKARSTGEILGILRAAAPARDGRGHPIGMWKTGWHARSEGVAPDRDGRGHPIGMWKTGWDAPPEGVA